MNRTRKAIFFGIVLLFVFCILSINLMNSAIWLDESVEYFILKNEIKGCFAPFYGSNNMNERICSTCQPPLYNYLMYIWLLLFDSEVGFRMAGVVATLVGGVGIYFICQKKSFVFACCAMIIYSTIHGVVFYAQECAEYNLMMCFVVWTFYFFIETIENARWINIIPFCLCAIGAIYSQYGAAFVIVGMFMNALGYEYEYLDLEDDRIKEIREYSSEMPLYPSVGYIEVVDGVTVVKLSELN